MNTAYRNRIRAANPLDLAEYIDDLINSLYGTLADIHHPDNDEPFDHNPDTVTHRIDTELEDANDWLDELEVAYARTRALPDRAARILLDALIDNIADRLRTQVHQAKRAHERRIATSRITGGWPPTPRNSRNSARSHPT